MDTSICLSARSRLGFLTLVLLLAKEKENSEFKPVEDLAIPVQDTLHEQRPQDQTRLRDQ